MKTVCIVIGHSPQREGAFNATHQLGEYDYNCVLAGQIAEKLHRRGVKPIVMYRGSSYTKMISEVNRTGADLAIELHCNGNVDTSIQGQATLYYHSSTKSKRLAECVQKAVFGLFNERNRGIKPKNKGDRGGLFLLKTAMPAILLEPFFITNDESVELGLALREQLASVVANALVDHLK